MVEQEAVNFEVAGSSPAVGAKKRRVLEALFFLAMNVMAREPGLLQKQKWFGVVRRSSEKSLLLSERVNTKGFGRCPAVGAKLYTN